MINNLAKYLFLCLCWFFVLEIFSRMIISIKPFYESYIKNVSDAGMKLENIRSNGFLEYKNSRSVSIYQPTRGWAVRPNLIDQKVYDNKFLNTNSKGIRGKIEYNYEKNPDKTRILILGDSFTFGEEVNDTETFPYYLQQKLPDAEIINFGVKAYGQDQILIYLLEEGLKYNPDIVLLGDGWWENRRNLSEFQYRSKPRFRWNGNQLVLCNSPVPSPQWFLKHDFWRSRFLDLIEIMRFDLLNKIGVINREAEIITDHILDKIVSTARKNNTKIIFIPLSHMFTNQSPVLDSDPYKKRFIETWEKKGVPCIFIRPFPLFEQTKGVLQGGHYAPFVNERIAQGIKDYLLNNHLVKSMLMNPLIK
jgi:hypothetical protein